MTNLDLQQALDMAVTLRGPAAGLIHHSDRGSAYGSGKYREALDLLGTTKSMRR